MAKNNEKKTLSERELQSLEDAINNSDIVFTFIEFSLSDGVSDTMSKYYKEIKDIKEIWKGENSNNRYYVFLYNKCVFVVWLDGNNGNKDYVIYNYSHKQVVTINVNKDSLRKAIDDNNENAESRIIKLHRVQRVYRINNYVLSTITIMALVMCSWKGLKQTVNTLSVIALNISIIVSLEDVFVFSAKKLIYLKWRRRAMISVLLSIAIESALIILLIVAIFNDCPDNVFTNTYMMIYSVLSILLVMGGLLIRKETINNV